MGKKIEIEAVKIKDGFTYYNCTAYNPSGEVIGFMKELLPDHVEMFVRAFTVGSEILNKEI